MDRVERRIIFIASFAHMVSHFNTGVFPALVLPLTDVLGISIPAVVQLSFWHYLLFGITALPWGVLGDWVGARFLLVVFFAGCAVSGFACALYVDSPWALSAGLAGLGLFSGIYHPIGMGLISKGVRTISLAMGYNAVFGGVGLVIAPLVAGIMNWIWGPAALFVFVGLLNLVGTSLVMLCPDTSTVERAQTTPSGQENGNLKAFLLFLLPVGLAGLAFTGSSVVLPAYLELNSPSLFHSLRTLVPGSLSNNVMATAITAIVYLVGMVGQYAGGVAGQRFETKYSYLTFHALCIPSAFLMAVATDVSLASLAMLYFFFLLGMQPSENTLVAHFAPKRLHHSAFGLKFVFTFGVGSLAVKMVGWINQAWGLSSVFIALGVCSILTVASIVVLLIVSSKRTATKQSFVEAR